MGLVYKFLLPLALAITTIEFTAWARPPLDMTQDEVIAQQPGATDADAKQEAFRKAVEDATSKLISETLGPGVLEKHAARIKQVLSRSEKYVLFIKGSNPEATPDGVRVKVDMKISLDNFEALLREYGLLQSGTKGLKLIPLVAWSIPGSSVPYAWWADSSGSPAAKSWSKFMNVLNSRLKARNVRVADALSIQRVPPALRKPNLSRDEQMALAKVFDASLILFGEAQFGKGDDANKAHLQTELIDMESQHSLGTTQSSFGPAKDELALIVKLAEGVNEQVKTAEASGDMNIARFRLVVQGNLSYPKLEQLRHDLLAQVLDIRSLKDRLYAPNEVIFEAESNRTTAELASEIRKVHFTNLKVDAQDGGAGAVNLHVMAQ